MDFSGEEGDDEGDTGSISEGSFESSEEEEEKKSERFESSHKLGEEKMVSHDLKELDDNMRLRVP